MSRSCCSSMFIPMDLVEYATKGKSDLLCIGLPSWVAPSRQQAAVFRLCSVSTAFQFKAKHRSELLAKQNASTLVGLNECARWVFLCQASNPTQANPHFWSGCSRVFGGNEKQVLLCLQSCDALWCDLLHLFEWRRRVYGSRLLRALLLYMPCVQIPTKYIVDFTHLSGMPRSAK